MFWNQLRMMMNRKYCLLLLLAFCFSCKKDYTPKPVSFFRIDEQKADFVRYNHLYFSFDLPSDTRVNLEKKGTSDVWLTIRFPKYRAYLYCTYLPIHKSSLRAAIDDSYRMTFSHSIKANGISQKVVDLPKQHSGGVIYQIDGNVATPRQFFVTDSVSNFFRASLYFDGKMNADSLQPVIKYMDSTINRMISSFKWKN